MNTIKHFASFPSLTLHTVNLLLWKKMLSLTLFKIITVSRPSTLFKVLLMGRSGFPFKGGTWGGWSILTSKISNLPLPLDITPASFNPAPKNWVFLDPLLILELKGICYSFLTNLTKNFTCNAREEFRNHELFEKARWR